MAYRVLVLPPYPLTDRAKTTLEGIIDLLQKPIICETQLKSTREINGLNLGELETTSERTQSDPIFEYYENPLAGKSQFHHGAGTRLAGLIGSDSYSAAGFLPGWSKTLCLSPFCALMTCGQSRDTQ